MLLYRFYLLSLEKYSITSISKNNDTMKKLLFILTIATVMVSCNSKPEKTIENLKAAATGESNATAMYAKFAERAAADSLFNVAAMFRATSASEAVHLKSYLAVLDEMGVQFTPVVEEVTVGTTLENLAKAKDGEDYEMNVMYPSSIETATSEKADNAVKNFKWAMTAEGKHAQFYDAAAQAIAMDGNDLNVVGEWLVCPVCGDTYRRADIGAACDLCGTPAEKFMEFTLL